MTFRLLFSMQTCNRFFFEMKAGEKLKLRFPNPILQIERARDHFHRRAEWLIPWLGGGERGAELDKKEAD